MRSRQIDKQQRKPSLSARHKPSLQQQPRTFKPKQKQQKKELIKLPKKTSSKPISRQNQKSFKNSLFNSVQQLPNRLKDRSQKNGRKQKMQQMPISSYTKIEDTTASRQANIVTKQYNRPNGEYFGGQPSMHSQSKSIKSTRAKMHSTCTKLSKSLEDRIKEFRSIENMHESQSQSLKSDISDREMRRLKKIHSLEKMKLMEEIIDIEEKIIKNKHRI